METPVDFLEVFPDDFLGNPNITITPDGRRFSPKKRVNYDEDYYPEDDGYNEDYSRPSSHRGASFINEVPNYGAANTQVITDNTFRSINNEIFIFRSWPSEKFPAPTCLN